MSPRQGPPGSRGPRSGATAVHLAVLLVPVIFGFMGFAVDFGRLYLIRAELKTAADAAAIAAANQLAGTDSSESQAADAVTAALSNANGANRFDFGGTQVGESEGLATSTASEPGLFETLEEALQTEAGGAGTAGGSNARHVRVEITANAPTTFFRLFASAAGGTIPVRVDAVAGMSAPLCMACGIEAIGIAALSTDDTEDFGFQAGSVYTLGYQCTGPNAPQALAGSIQRVPYLLLNRLNEEAEAFADEATQTLRIGAGGLPLNTTEALRCVSVDAAETVWQTATPLGCLQNTVPAQVRGFLCGMGLRIDSTPGAGCENIADVDSVAEAYQADTNIDVVEEYAAYDGNRRRIMTVAIVDSLADPTAMTVLGFRQFLLNPAADGTVNTSDQNGRFLALYLGSVMPLRNGRFSGCSIATGPGKVVLHK